MLKKVEIDGIKLPRLYIAENARDAEVAMANGVPYIKWTKGQEELVKILLRPVLEKMFPHIKWDKVLGRRKKFSTHVHVCHEHDDAPDQLELMSTVDEEAENLYRPRSSEPIELNDSEDTMSYEDMTVDENGIVYEDSYLTEEERTFDVTNGITSSYDKMSVFDYMGDMSSYVNIEMLQRLRLMPAFIGDILDCVKLNLGSGMYWREGYNKKLGLLNGRFDASRQLPNLVILDVSGSIPRGISATMIALIDTLRTQLSADLIITSSISMFYPMGSELPSPQTLRNQFGYGNEANMFFDIMAKNISGKHYGHVFSFGDNDTPSYFNYDRKNFPSMCGTKVEFVHHYHTWSEDDPTGYAKWCHMLADEPEVEHDSTWCDFIRR